MKVITSYLDMWSGKYPENGGIVSKSIEDALAKIELPYVGPDKNGVYEIDSPYLSCPQYFKLITVAS